MSETINNVLKDIQNKLTLEGKKSVFEDEKELKSDYLKRWQDPEEFTREYLIDKILYDIFEVQRTGPKNFQTTDGTPRKVDYAVKYEKTKILIEAKPVNADLYDKSPNAAVNQIKGVFRLAEARGKFDYGIATDGLKWVFISKEGASEEFNIQEDFEEIKRRIAGTEKILQKKMEDISKKFYQEYNDLIHGVKNISKEDCLVNSIKYVENEEDREEIAQITIDRLIFIKFLQSKGIIKKDILSYLKELEEHELHLKLNQLFFEVMSTKQKNRGTVDPHFEHIPYLNGSLFEKVDVEQRNPNYRIQDIILHKVIEFLNKFRFTHSESLENKQDVIDPEILGYIFERAMTAQDRKGTGAYYTPKEITKYIAENTIHPTIIKKTNHFLQKEKDYKKSELINNIEDIYHLRATTLREIWEKIISNIKICDNACGSGAFLLAAANILFDISKRITAELEGYSNIPDTVLKRRILRCIYGVDINPRGIEIALLRLWLWLAESFKPEKIEPLPNIEYNLRVGNSLIGYVDIEQFGTTKITLDDFVEEEETTRLLLNKFRKLKNEYQKASGDKARKTRKEIEEIRNKIKKKLDKELYREIKSKNIDITEEEFFNIRPFHWGFEFYEIFDLDKPKNRRGFDVIIGNPPYIKSRDSKDVFFRKCLKKVGGYKTLYKMWDMYVPFVERSINLLKKDSHFSMIIPDTIGVSDYSSKLVDLITEEYSLYQIDFFPDIDVFVGVGVSNKIIFIKKNNKGKKCRRIIHEKDVGKTRVLGKKSNRKPEIFKLKVSEIDFDFEDTILLQDVCYVSYGLRLNSHKDDPDSFKKADLLSDKRNETHSKPYTEGKYIDRYRINKKLFVEWGTDRCPERLVRPTFPELYPPEKILMAREKRVSTISDEGIICDNTIILGVPYHKLKGVKNRSISRYFGNLDIDRAAVEKKSVNYDLRYLLAILNSSLISYFLEYNARSKTDSYPDDWKKVPIKVIPKEEQKPFIQLVDKMLSLNKDLKTLTDKKTDKREKIERKIKKTNKKIDNKIYDLYGLTKKEIKIVEESLKE